MIKKIFGVVLGCLVLFTACKERETRDLDEIEDTLIKEFLAKNNLTSSFEKDSTGFYYQILEEGEGENLQYSNQVFFLMDMKTLSGNSVQSAGNIINSAQVSFMPNLNSVDRGFLGYLSPVGLREALLKTRYGGKMRALLPSYMMYGKNGYSTVVAGNTVLDVTVEILKGKTQVAAEDSLINKYLKLQPDTYEKDEESGIYYHIVSVGEGSDVTSTSTVKAVYTGKFLNGEVFDSSTAENPLEISLSNTIAAWGAILPKIKTGGKIKMFVPSYRAYSTSGNGRIIPNTPLYFEVELL